MSRILVIKSSARGAQSASSHLADHLVARLLAKNPAATIDALDVGAQPLPVLTGDTLAAYFTPAEQQDFAMASIDASSRQLIERFQAADIVVIAFGLYNFSIPTSLRTLIDSIARAGITFAYTESGPVGLLTNKKVVIVAASGGVYTTGPAQAMDFGTPYLRTVLGFLGMTDIEVVTAEGLATAADQGEAILANARLKVEAIAETL